MESCADTDVHRETEGDTQRSLPSGVVLTRLFRLRHIAPEHKKAWCLESRAKPLQHEFGRVLRTAKILAKTVSLRPLENEVRRSQGTRRT